MFSDSCSASDAGCCASWRVSTVLPGPPDPRELGVWDTRPSKVNVLPKQAWFALDAKDILDDRFWYICLKSNYIFRIHNLPCENPQGRSQEASTQGSGLWQAQERWYQPAEEPEVSPGCCWSKLIFINDSRWVELFNTFVSMFEGESW